MLMWFQLFWASLVSASPVNSSYESYDRVAASPHPIHGVACRATTSITIITVITIIYITTIPLSLFIRTSICHISPRQRARNRKNESVADLEFNGTGMQQAAQMVYGARVRQSESCKRTADSQSRLQNRSSTHANALQVHSRSQAHGRCAKSSFLKLVNSPEMTSHDLNSPQFNSISLKPSFAGSSSHLDLEIILLSFASSTERGRGSCAAREPPLWIIAINNSYK